MQSVCQDHRPPGGELKGGRCYSPVGMAPSPFRRPARGNADGAQFSARSGHPLDGVPLLALLEPDLRARVRKRLSQRKVAVGRALFRQGDPADALLNVARDVGASTIVVGNRGMRGGRRVLGSVPNSVSHKAPCNVLIVQTDQT